MKPKLKSQRVLERVRQLTDEMECRLRDLEFYDRVKVMENNQLAINLEDEAEQAFRDVEEMFELRKKMSVLINKLSKADYKSVLRMRYFSGHTWKYIAHRLFYDMRYVYTLHGLALQELDTIMKEDAQNAD